MTAEPPVSSGAMTGAPPTEPEPTRLRGGLLRHHDFRQLFIGDSLSQVGTQLTMLAIPILAVNVLDAGAFQMGLLATCEFLAFLVIGLPAGAWVDRWRKRRGGVNQQPHPPRGARIVAPGGGARPLG